MDTNIDIEYRGYNAKVQIQDDVWSDMLTGLTIQTKIKLEAPYLKGAVGKKIELDDAGLMVEMYNEWFRAIVDSKLGSEDES